MNHYTFAETFRSLYDQAVAAYAAGKRGADTFFDAKQSAWLAANGLAAQALYDYAEDHNGYQGEPGYDRALSIEAVRRDYFFNVQQGVASDAKPDPGAWPGKSETIEGIAWLPRLLPKARAKLRGELPSSLMFCCAGDRKFFKEHNIFPAEFLSLIWRAGDDDQAIVRWVKARKA